MLTMVFIVRFRIENSGEEIVDFPARYGKNAPEGLPSSLLLCLNCPVMLNANISVSQGLFNGALGSVVRFGPLDPDSGLPECIFAKFDQYFGPRYGVLSEIPICRMKRPKSDPVLGRSYSKIQFPLVLAYSLTVHKACKIIK